MFGINSRCVFNRFAGAACLLAIVAFRWPSEDSPFRKILTSLLRFYATALPGKAYLHLDRPFYAQGETIWFKAYVVEADSHRPDTLSKILYVELVSARRAIVARRTLRLRAGMAPGDLALPDTLPAGTYQLRAYTNWMRNAGPAFFFRRPLAVLDAQGSLPVAPLAAAKTDLQFFPEGGNLIDGVESEVGFRAIDGHGHGVDVQGNVLDGQGHEVARFRSRHLGMGTFRLVSTPGHAYRAVVTGPGGTRAEYPLPASQPTGYALRVSETETDFLVTIRQHLAPGAPPAGPALLLAHVRGQASYAVPVPGTGLAPVAVRLPKSKFRPGLAHLTLFDEQGTAQCERLVFVPNLPGARVTLTADRAAYSAREAVQLHLTATDATGKPVAGQFSVAVTAGTGAEPSGPTIVSHLLLGSDLAGPIEAPGYYFQEPQTPEIRQALNDLLLTQGWRRFVWKELLATPLPAPAFLPEQALAVSGQVIDAGGQPAVRTISYLQTNPTRQAEMQTDAAGHFRFRGLDGLDTAHVMLRAQPLKGEKELKIGLLAPPAVEPAGLPDALLTLPGSPTALIAYVKASQQQALQETATRRTIALKNVQVRGSQPGLAVPDDAVRPYSVGNATVLQVGDLARTGDSRTVMQYLQGRIAGVTVSREHANIRNAATMQDQNTGTFGLVEPLYVIDGNIVPHAVFVAYPIREVQSIDVLKQSAAAIFGTQGYGGVIAVHSRTTGILPTPKPEDIFAAARTGVLSMQVPGYYRAREFYAPRYDAGQPAAAPDPRHTTLYWAPMVQTDASGQAHLSFYTSHAVGGFSAVAEGLSAQGLPLRGGTGFVVTAAAR